MRQLAASQEAATVGAENAAAYSGQHSVDTVAGEYVAGAMTSTMDDVAAHQREVIVQDQSLDMTAKPEVAVGSIIVLDGDRYLIGVAAGEFHSGDVAYAGISVESPIFEHMVGLTAGQSFTFRDSSHSIDAVC